MEEGGVAIRKSDLTRFQWTMRTFVSSVVPNHARRKDGTEVVEHYIDHYNCKPPPLFMILISVIEVSYHGNSVLKLFSDDVKNKTVVTIKIFILLHSEINLYIQTHTHSETLFPTIIILLIFHR